jgi:hypothetical protein
MTVCVHDRKYESHLVQPANDNSQWSPVIEQCKGQTSKIKEDLVLAMTWKMEELMRLSS